MKQSRRYTIAASCDHINFQTGTLHDKLKKIVVHCAADFVMRHQNLHYNISSQHKIKTDNEYVPKSYQIKLELAVEKGTKYGEAFQDLTEKHSQCIAKCQLNLKSLVIEAEDIDLVIKKNSPITSFVESVYNISERF